jgi:hypothetical protein
MHGNHHAVSLNPSFLAEINNKRSHWSTLEGAEPPQLVGVSKLHTEGDILSIRTMGFDLRQGEGTPRGYFLNKFRQSAGKTIQIEWSTCDIPMRRVPTISECSRADASARRYSAGSTDDFFTEKKMLREIPST